MYAVLRTGGKQYKVGVGERFRAEKLKGEVGSTIELKEVLMIGGETPLIGTPVVPNAVATLEIMEQGKGDKLMVFRFRRRKDSKRHQGHRQPYTELRLVGLKADGVNESAPKEAKKAKPEASAETTKKATTKKATTKKATTKKATTKKATTKKATTKKATTKKTTKKKTTKKS
jgi:large subunit ribosomal protein L21